MEQSSDEAQQYRLPAGHELRLEVDSGSSVFLTLREGSAEVFGTALELGDRVKLCGQKVAVFSWDGCLLEMTGQPSVQYQSEDTPMVQYLNVHDTLEARRQAAQRSGGNGPRTFIVGPTDVGKSTLSKVLLNYAVRTGWAPLFVDLDVGQGAVTVPGCVGATPVESPIEVEEGMPTDAPLVYFCTHVSPSENPHLYRQNVERLAAVVDARARTDKAAAASGVVFNSMGWVEDLGFELLLHSIDAMSADVVLVVGDERLYSRLSGKLTGGGVAVVKLPRSGGVVTRSREMRAAARKERVEEYFYGPGRDLAPASQTAKVDDLHIYRVGGGPKAPSSALPLGATSVADPLKLTKVTNLRDLLFTLLAVSHAASPEELLASSVAGFIYVQDVDVAQGTVTYLAPCPGKLPGQLLLAGTFKTYLE